MARLRTGCKQLYAHMHSTLKMVACPMLCFVSSIRHSKDVVREIRPRDIYSNNFFISQAIYFIVTYII